MTEDEKWITQTAEAAVCELLNQVAGIRVRRLPETERDTEVVVVMDAVYGHIHGDDRMEVRLRAEPAIFYQLTRNVSGDEPQDEGEVWEYAEEFFNVLCGRFISAICNRDHIRMRFDPPRYQKAADVSDMETDRLLHTLSFKTEKDELLEFLWGKAELCC